MITGFNDLGPGKCQKTRRFQVKKLSLFSGYPPIDCRRLATCGAIANLQAMTSS